MKIARIYYCTKCQTVVIRFRDPAARPYLMWCCGEKMISVNRKCDVCGKKIRGSNHFQGKHHLAKVKGVMNGK